MSDRQHAIVVGAGIAGLAAAYRLQEHGLEVTVLEAERTVGGRMSSLHRGGFKLDRAAVALSDQYTHMHRLIDDVGIRQLVVPCPEVIGIPKGGRVHHLGTRSPLAALSTPLLSWRSKLASSRVAIDAWRLQRGHDWHDLGASGRFDHETVREWALRRGGPDLYYVIDAAVRGGLMTDSAKASALDTQFLMLKFFNTTLFTFADGVGVLPDALAARLPDVRFGCRATEVVEDAGEVRVSYVRDGSSETTLSADACVITLSAHAMASVHPQLPQAHRAIVDDVEYVRLIAVNLALDRRPPEPSLFLAFAEEAEPELAAIFFAHNRHPGRAPAGKGLITVYWHHDWNTAHWRDDDAEIVRHSIDAASRHLPGLEDMVLWSHIERWDPSFIYSRPGTYRALHEIARSRAGAKRIHLAGDYFGGPSTNTSLCSGELAATNVISALSGARVPALT